MRWKWSYSFWVSLSFFFLSLFFPFHSIHTLSSSHSLFFVLTFFSLSHFLIFFLIYFFGAFQLYNYAKPAPTAAQSINTCRAGKILKKTKQKPQRKSHQIVHPTVTQVGLLGYPISSAAGPWKWPFFSSCLPGFPCPRFLPVQQSHYLTHHSDLVFAPGFTPSSHLMTFLTHKRGIVSDVEIMHVDSGRFTTFFFFFFPFILFFWLLVFYYYQGHWLALGW